MKRALNAVAIRIGYICCGFRQEAEHIKLVTKCVDCNLETPCYAAVCVRRRDGDRRIIASVIGRKKDEISAWNIRCMAVTLKVGVSAVFFVVQRYTAAGFSVGIRVGPLHSI